MTDIDESDPDTVHDRESFLMFVRALIADRHAAIEAERLNPTNPQMLGLVDDAGGWYNFTIETYLEAALNWAEASGKGPAPAFPSKPSWKAFADFLYCGKIYE